MIRSVLRCQRFKLPLRIDSKGFHVLGIESSCDDTGAAVLNDEGTILGEGLISQARLQVEFGGIIPNVAHLLHKQNLKDVVDSSMKQSQLNFNNLSAIAVTVTPGLMLSLGAGLNYAKELCSTHKIPLIPIHHMEAHALTARMCEEVKFPFLVFLMSGGHCILALVKSVTEFHTLGGSLDTSPGQLFDRIARRTKLLNNKKFRKMSAGASVEAAASGGDPVALNFIPRVLPHSRNCSFSFAGLETVAIRYVENQEKALGLQPGEIIPDFEDFCASIQWAIARHMCQRLQNAIIYLDKKNLLDEKEKCLVVSGGVASNSFIRSALKFVCDHYSYRMVVPPPKLCTDNGVMIAWNGVEKLKESCPLVLPHELHTIEPTFKCPLGEDLSDDVETVLSQRLSSETTLKLKEFIKRYKNESQEEEKMAKSGG